MPPPRPLSLQINAWRGGAGGVSGAIWDGGGTWGLGADASRFDLSGLGPTLGPPPIADDRDWRHEEVGWGLIVPDDHSIPRGERAAGEDLPPSLQRLLAARNAPLFRYNPTNPNYLRVYVDGQPAQDWEPASAARGRTPGKVPKYLMICGSPAKIPWRVQYALNMSSFVGRIDLQGDALDRYVECLINGFPASHPAPLKPVIWSVNHGGADITSLMQQVIADRVSAAFSGDAAFAPIHLSSANASIANLVDTLDSARPALIVTTSHGSTDPTSGADALRARLGGLVDANRDVLLHAALTPASTGGAIWYSHACCSAGSDSKSQLEALFSPGHDIGDTLRDVSTLAGAMIAPLPQALLSAERPIRAFIGHVEPTFDWTLRDPATYQVSPALAESLYRRLYQDNRYPIGYALANHFAEAAGFQVKSEQAERRLDDGDFDAMDAVKYYRIAALDRLSTVILGDPAVAIPAAP